VLAGVLTGNKNRDIQGRASSVLLGKECLRNNLTDNESLTETQACVAVLSLGYQCWF